MDILTYVLSKKYTDKVVTSLAGGMQYKGSKPTVADLPTPSESIKGHLYTVTENGHEYVCDGKEWVDLSKDLDNKADKTELAAEILARSSADTDLQNNITTEANSRTSADNALQEGINQEAIAREQADTTLQSNIDTKAALPSELPPELKVPGVDYPWFMINMEPKGIDADGNLRLDHSGYNFNTKQYYTWTDKVIPMAATETTGGVMTAADKVKLNKAITEHQDISGKLNVLPNVDDPEDPGYGWPYHIPYSFETVPESGKLRIILKTLTLDNKVTKMDFEKVLPGATIETAGLMTASDKQSLANKQDMLTAGANIKLDGNVISVEVESVELTGTSGTLTDEQATLLNNSLTVISLNNKCFRLSKVLAGSREVAATYVCAVDTSADYVTVGLIGKFWEYHAVELQGKLTAGENITIIDNVISAASGGTTNFNELTNRPSYNGLAMTGLTSIPEVKTTTWDAKQDAISDLDTIRAGAALGATAIQEHQDISGKLNVLPKVDDPTDPGYGWEYHIPYRFDFSTDAEKLNVKLHTLTLDNKLTKMKFDSSVPSATSTNAGLMSAADKALVDTISSKADLPSELPPELKVPGVDYPWFMINMNPKSIDAQGQLHLDHSGYNFNTKQYYTWTDKIIPMAATETTGGLMTAADKVKLNAAITEHQDISGKLNVLPKVDDPTDPGYGWEYHIPYRFDFALDESKLDVTLHTLTLDNKLTKMQFNSSIPSATIAAAGLLSAADKVKLDAAITEHQDISGKQDKLTAGDGITIDANNNISANVRTYKAYPSSWPHSYGTTIASFCAAVNESYKKGEIKIGDAFLGNITSPIFFSGVYVENGGALGSAEVSVQIMTSFGENCVQLLTTTSSNNPPYHWEYTYVDGASTEGWRCWTSHSYLEEKLLTKQDVLTAGENITITDNTISVEAKSIELSGTSGSLTDEQAIILSNSMLNYIVLNGKQFRISKVTPSSKEVLANYTCATESGTEFIIVALIGKSWEYHAFAFQPLAAYIELNGSIADGTWHDGGTLSEDQVDVLLASELNYIWMNGMHRLDFRYKDDYNNLATYSAQDGEKSHLIEITLSDKTWRYKHITEAPDDDGTYVFKCVVSGGVKTYSWVKE